MTDITETDIQIRGCFWCPFSQLNVYEEYSCGITKQELRDAPPHDQWEFFPKWCPVLQRGPITVSADWEWLRPKQED